MKQLLRVRIAKILLISFLFTQNGILAAPGAIISPESMEDINAIPATLSDNEATEIAATSSNAAILDDNLLQDKDENRDTFNNGWKDLGLEEIATSSNANVSDDREFIRNDKENIIPSKLATLSNAYMLRDADKVWDGVTEKEVVPIDNTYYIRVPAELAWVRKVTNEGTENFEGKTISVLSDLDMGGYEWEGIGTLANPFKGGLNGEGHIISGLKQENQTSSMGLFGAIEVQNNIVIKDLNIDTAEFYGNAAFAGVLSGYIKLKSGATLNISGVETSGILDVSNTTTSSFGGGLVGNIYSSNNSTVNIEKVKTEGDMTISYSALNNTVTNTGGLVGCYDNKYGNIVVRNSSSSMNINTTAQNSAKLYTGGIFGSANGNQIEFNMVYATGTLVGKSNDACVGGGIIGSCETDNLTINNSYAANIMDIGGRNGVVGGGGLIGFLKCRESYKDSFLRNCHVSGHIGSIQYAAFILQNDSNTETLEVSNCYYNRNSMGLKNDKDKITHLGFLSTTRLDCPNGYGITDSEMEEESSFVGWDFDNIWTMQGNGYPELQENDYLNTGLKASLDSENSIIFSQETGICETEVFDLDYSYWIDETNIFGEELSDPILAQVKIVLPEGFSFSKEESIRELFISDETAPLDYVYVSLGESKWDTIKVFVDRELEKQDSFRFEISVSAIGFEIYSAYMNIKVIIEKDSGELLEVIDVRPVNKTCLEYLYIKDYTGSKYPVILKFKLEGIYEKTDNLTIALRNYTTDEVIAYAKEIELITEELITEFWIHFDPLPQNIKIYPGIEEGLIINSDTGDSFSVLSQKENWWYETPKLIENVWGFENYIEGIDYETCEMIFGATKGKEIYDELAGNRGLCAGMVGTVMDLHEGYLDYTDFSQDSEINRIEDIKKNAIINKLNMDVNNYIKSSFVFQMTDEVSKQEKNNMTNWRKNNLKELYDAVIKNESVYIAVNDRPLFFGKIKSHAFWGYGIEKGDGYSDILIYDSNKCNAVGHIRLYGNYPTFTKWEVCLSDETWNEITFVTEYPSAYSYLDSKMNGSTEIQNDKSVLLKTDLNNFKVSDSRGNSVSKEQIYSIEQDAIIPITVASIASSNDGNLDMYWIEPNATFEATNNETEPKEVSVSSNAQIITIDMANTDSLSISTDNKNETMDIQMKHNGDSNVTAVYDFVVDDKIATIQLTGKIPDTAVIYGKNDGADINGFDVTAIKASYNEQTVKKKLDIPSNTKINVSVIQASGDAYLKVAYDSNDDGNCDTDLVAPIPFNPSNAWDSNIPATAIDFHVSKDKIYVGDIIQLTANVQPETATDKSVVWTSSDNSLATVSADGVLRAIKAGIVTISVKLANGSLEKVITIEIKNRSEETLNQLMPDSTSENLSDNSNYSTITFDRKKGYINSLTGIITGKGARNSKWKQETSGWKLFYIDGTYASGSSSTDGNGEVHEQILWELINGVWFAFGTDGYAKEGFVYDYSLMEWFYIDINKGMLIGWQFINGSWYYFSPISNGKKGRMITDTWIDNYYLNGFGIWEQDKEKNKI